jgi:hypothetical protein
MKEYYMKLAPVTVRSQAVETSPFQGQPLPKLPALPHKHQRQGKDLLHLIFDFDETLSVGTMQHGKKYRKKYKGLLAQLGFKNPDDFWNLRDKRKKRTGEGPIEAYMNELLHVAKKSELKNVLTPANLHSLGQSIPLAPNVPFFMPRLQLLAKNSGIELDFHIVSSGIEEMIKGNSVADYVKSIRANRFKYNRNQQAKGLDQIIEASDKVHHIKEILKEPKLILPPIYIGDSPSSDGPAFEYVQHKLGGKSILVYDPTKPNKVAKAEEALEEALVNSIHPRNYQAGTSLMNHLGEIIETHAKAEDSKPKLILLS